MTQNGWTRNASTIAEVAHAAGVSRATVSRVMNGRSTVDPELAARVREVAEQLHYRPSNTARSLSLGRTNTVAVVVPDLANPMFQQVLRGVASAAADEGYRVLVADTAEHAADEERIALDARLRCDALVLVSPRMPEGTLRALLPEIGPVVVVNRAADGVTPTLGHRLRRGDRRDRRAPDRPGPSSPALPGRAARQRVARRAAGRAADRRGATRGRPAQRAAGRLVRRVRVRRRAGRAGVARHRRRRLQRPRGVRAARAAQRARCGRARATCRSRVSTTSSSRGSRRPRSPPRPCRRRSSAGRRGPTCARSWAVRTWTRRRR